MKLINCLKRQKGYCFINYEYFLDSHRTENFGKKIGCALLGALAEDTERPYIRALQCAMCLCLQKATAMRSNAIFFLLHCGAKHQNYDLVLACFSLLCNPNAINLSRVAFHMESEKHAI